MVESEKNLALYLFAQAITLNEAIKTLKPKNCALINDLNAIEAPLYPHEHLIFECWVGLKELQYGVEHNKHKLPEITKERLWAIKIILKWILDLDEKMIEKDNKPDRVWPLFIDDLSKRVLVNELYSLELAEDADFSIILAFFSGLLDEMYSYGLLTKTVKEMSFELREKITKK